MKIWNVSIQKSSVSIVGYQVEARNIKEAYDKAESTQKGTIIRISLAEYDNAY